MDLINQILRVINLQIEPEQSFLLTDNLLFNGPNLALNIANILFDILHPLLCLLEHMIPLGLHSEQKLTRSLRVGNPAVKKLGFFVNSFQILKMLYLSLEVLCVLEVVLIALTVLLI